MKLTSCLPVFTVMCFSIVRGLKVADDMEEQCHQTRNSSICYISIKGKDMQVHTSIISCRKPPAIQTILRVVGAAAWRHTFVNENEVVRRSVAGLQLVLHCRLGASNNTQLHVQVHLRSISSSREWLVLSERFSVRDSGSCYHSQMQQHKAPSRTVMLVSVCLLLAVLLVCSTLLIVLSLRCWRRRRRVRRSRQHTTLDSSLELLSCDDFEELRRNNTSLASTNFSASTPIKQSQKKDKSKPKKRNWKRRKSSSSTSRPISNGRPGPTELLVKDTDSLQSLDSGATTDRLRPGVHRLGYMRPGSQRNSLLRHSLASVPESDVSDPFM